MVDELEVRALDRLLVHVGADAEEGVVIEVVELAIAGGARIAVFGQVGDRQHKGPQNAHFTSFAGERRIAGARRRAGTGGGCRRERAARGLAADPIVRFTLGLPCSE